MWPNPTSSNFQRKQLRKQLRMQLVTKLLNLKHTLLMLFVPLD